MDLSDQAAGNMVISATIKCAMITKPMSQKRLEHAGETSQQVTALH